MELRTMRKSLLPLTVSLALLGGLTGCQQEEAKQEEKEYAIPVETASVARGDITSFYSTTATLEAPEEAKVVTRIAGMIEYLPVEEGMKVKKGDLLAVIDADRQQYSLDAKIAEVSIIEQELDRLKKISNKNFVSAEQIAKLEYNLQAAKAQRDLAALQVEESRVLSPIDGTIAVRYVKQGNMAKEFDPLFHIVNQEELHGIVHLPEKQLQSLKQGQTADIYTSRDPNRAYAASVLRISPVVDASSGTFKVTLSVPNSSRELKAGMFTRVELKYDTHEDVITVPYQAVINQDNRQALYVVSEGNAERREVELGYRNGDTVEIRSGLEAGEQLVIRGQQNLKDQSLVEIINPQGMAAVATPVVANSAGNQ
ncbi:efflux RND transporter periplasmic adaptor subunit [Shewanella corallii]|uniref:Efflux RND transporter periplasmic adaptor subunit n=1 Tax=Shewanella corallii TaxID=560080 RepID=A0ABT0N7H0_9GAMM|nr:efflux RND transporter periplasmic adaptor subunit [Shewanella corallii]MCL2914325.1 efflux RND transporter periplasmic adaptor subunit [Shewanella corallii]